MGLSLPVPVHPAGVSASSSQARAHRRWKIGQGHAEREQWPLAAAAFEQACALDTEEAYGLAAAHALIKAGRSPDAVRRARSVRAIHPGAVLAYTIESHALLCLGRASEAVQCLRELPASVPRDHPYLVSLAVALQRCRKFEEAVRTFFEALALKMDDAIAHFRLGMTFKDMGMKAEAAECVRTAVMLGVGPSDLAARAQLAFLEREACRWKAAEVELSALRLAVRAVAPDIPLETGAFIHTVLVGDPLEQLKVARHYAMHTSLGIRPLPRRSARTAAKRLRIGYLSADFHQHATSQLMAQMLESHDRQAFEVTLLSTGPDDNSTLRQRMLVACEHFEELRNRGFETIARRIRELEIDILVDLKGATYDTLMPVLAYRAAPVQVTWLGFPGTTGSSAIDYLVGDEVVSPICNAAHFAEKIAQLPHCYQPNDAKRPLPRPSKRSDWGAPEDALLMCAFHQSYKISAEVFDRWCELLHANSNAVLWLLQWNANVQTTLLNEARARGIAAHRLVFSPVVPIEDHLSRLACADIYLDAWPCNAHTTASEALWVGVPVVTLKGEAFAQRVAASLLHSVALDELICQDQSSYMSTALALLNSPERRAQIKTHLIAQRARSPLFDGARQARDLEQLYQRMWQRFTRGLPADHLPASGA